MPSWPLGRIRFIQRIVGTSNSFFIFVGKFDSGVIFRIIIFCVLVSVIHSGILRLILWVLVFAFPSGLMTLMLWIPVFFLRFCMLGFVFRSLVIISHFCASRSMFVQIFVRLVLFWVLASGNRVPVICTIGNHSWDGLFLFHIIIGYMESGHP